MEYRKVLSKYYKRWAKDSEESAIICQHKGALRLANEYIAASVMYRKIIEKNSEAIEFFSKGQNAYIIDSALPEKFRGYK